MPHLRYVVHHTRQVFMVHSSLGTIFLQVLDYIIKNKPLTQTMSLRLY